MGACGFSFPTAGERREIRSLCKEIFNGRRSQEIFQAYSRWIPYIVDVFLPICDSESGDLRMLPFPGSLMDQPYMTMQIILTVQGEYKAFLGERVEKMKANTNRGGSRRPARRK